MCTIANFQLLSSIHPKLDSLACNVDSQSPIAVACHGVEMTFKSGKQSFQALKGIDLEVKRGSIQLLMGPSGSGKTTLLSILAGLLTPTKGKVCLLGHDITAMSRSQLSEFRLHNIGFIFQKFNLFPALTASENVEIVLKMKGVSDKEIKKEAQHLLTSVGLADKGEVLPRDLSGGQQQRVAIARALAGSPKLIMADEPTAALDSYNGHAVIELLARLAKQEGCTVIMVTHDPRIVDVADRVVSLEDGILQSRAPRVEGIEQKLS
jgi:putative ABC transport system ATP-binding protein